MQRKDLALRVLSTAAIMSIVTSIAAPAFADIYYIGNGSIDVVTKEDTDGKYVQVTQNGTTYTDRSNEIVIKDGTSETDTALREDDRAEGTRANPAVAPAAGAATLELEAAGTADAAGESQPDPDEDFTLSEEEEDSEEGKDPTDNPTANPTDDPTANSKKDVVFELDPADPEPEKPATKPTLSTSPTPAAATREATLADAAPAADPPTTSAVGSVGNPTTNVIKVINNWVDDATKELKIRLSNVNIKVGNAVDKAAMDVSGSGKTKVELDGQNTLDSSKASGQAGLRKQGEGTLTITDETSDKGENITAKKETETSGSLTAKGGGSNGAAGIGGSNGESTKNIFIEGYATVDAAGSGSGAGIGGGGSLGGRSGNAEKITIQGHSKVTATATVGAAIGGGGASGGNTYYGGSAKGIVIRDHATVVANGGSRDGGSGWGAAIGAAGDHAKDTEAEVTIGTAGATAEKEDVHVTATGFCGSAIGNGVVNTTVTIQGHATIRTANNIRKKGPNYGARVAIGSENGNVAVTIKDNVTIDAADDAANDVVENQRTSAIGGGYISNDSTRKVVVNIDGASGKVKIGAESALTGCYGAISGTDVKIGDNVLLKMKQTEHGKYINVNGAETAVGTRDNPAAGGLVIDDNTELWYTDLENKPQKIVHGKNVCAHVTGEKTGRKQDATCTEDGWVEYRCNYEKENGATGNSCDRTWTETIPKKGHTWGEWTVKTPATCEGEGEEHRTCSMCHKEETRKTAALGHQWKEDHRTGNCGVAGEIHYVCERDPNHTKTEPVAATGNHNFNGWHQTKAPTCLEEGEEQHECKVCGKPETRKVDKLAHVEELRGAKEPTCTEPGYTGDKWCTRGDHLLEKGSVIPATGHHWKDNGDGTHTCTKCGATEGQPVNTNSALELRVVDAEGMDRPFTVSQNGTLRTYTGAYDTATLTGDLNTLCYLQEHGAQTIQFVTNGQTSSFAINDLLAQGSGSEVFYLTHRGAEEPTLLLVEADHSELVKD